MRLLPPRAGLRLLGAEPRRSVARDGFVARWRDQDQHRVEAREVDGRHRLDLLVAPELALGHFGDARYRKAAREPLSFAARHEKIAYLDLVARVDHLDFARVARR